MNQTVSAPAGIRCDFAVVMPDDSMKDKGILPGDVVYFAACDHVDNGQTAAVLVGNAVFVRVVWQEGTRLSITPANPVYANTVLQGAEMDSVKIVGRVTAYFHIYPDTHTTETEKGQDHETK